MNQETNPVKRVANALEQLVAVQTQLLAIAMEARKAKQDMTAKLTAAMTAPMKEKE